jgi:hypothetical protein
VRPFLFLLLSSPGSLLRLMLALLAALRLGPGAKDTTALTSWHGSSPEEHYDHDQTKTQESARRQQPVLSTKVKIDQVAGAVQSPPLGEAGCRELLDFLETLAGRGRSAVLITSRTSEDWLGGIRRIAVGGLASQRSPGTRGKSWRPARRRCSGRDERGRVRRRTALDVTCPHVGGHLRAVAWRTG